MAERVRHDERQVLYSEIALARQRLDDAVWSRSPGRIREGAVEILEACYRYADELERSSARLG